MPYASLREFIDAVEREGELSRVKVEVDLDYELGAVCSRNYDIGGVENSKALIFERPGGYHTPLVVNLLGTSKRYSMAIDTTPDKFNRQWLERTAKPIPPVIVDHGPCKENIHKGCEVDLRELPVPIWNEKDGGPYITLPHYISKDPETGTRNVAIYRTQLHDRNIVGIMAAVRTHINMQWRKSHARGESFPVAIAIGVDPTVTLTAHAPFPFGVDELAMAGGLRGRPVELVRCETVPLEVPATAEWVLEGEVRPNALRKEGPFGEACGYYGEEGNYEFVEVKAITHRNNPIHQAAYIRKPPSEVLTVKRCWEAEVIRQCPMPGLVNISLPEGGCAATVAVASVKKTFDGQGKMMGMGILGTQAGRCTKVVIVVDEDIDPSNLTDVLWAISTRCQPERDVEVIKGVTGWGLDPSMRPHDQQAGTNLVSKMVIDATRPIKEPFAEVISPHKQMMAKVTREWSKYGLTY
ncbi:MAG: UbiD family decarboxylase [Chloroflexi bacterium]|nr:UbiD family decarboxylase [Chloroflexota bacterium]